MKINCPDCERGIPAADVNIQTSLARCTGCDSVFNITEVVGVSEIQQRWVQEEVGLPKGIVIDADGDALVIKRRWFRPALHIATGLFALVWNVFLIGWYSLVSQTETEGPMKIVSLIFPLGHVAVGLGLGYFSLSGFLNRTIVRASPEQLTVRHRPLKWIGEHTLHPDSIEQLYVQERVNRSNKGTRITYEVHAMLSGQRSKKLVSGLSGPEQAVFIVQQVEKHLGIKHLPVPGEYQPSIQVLRSGERSRDVGGLSMGETVAGGELSALDED